MKKLVYFVMALMAFVACSKEEKAPFNYRGLPFSLTVSQFVDSMVTRGFAVDSAASDSGKTLVFAHLAEPYRVLVAFQGDKLRAVQESYKISTNDSTRQLWQQMRDDLERQLGAWPDCPILKEDHKVANFDASDGIISVILENTYKPTLTVRYVPKAEEKN